MTDLGELIRAQCAERIMEGKAPTRAQLAWLAAFPEREPQSSVDIARNAKGDMQFSAKVYDADPHKASETAVEIVDGLRRRFPMADGTVGSPMREIKGKAS